MKKSVPSALTAKFVDSYRLSSRNCPQSLRKKKPTKVRARSYALWPSWQFTVLALMFHATISTGPADDSFSLTVPFAKDEKKSELSTGCVGSQFHALWSIIKFANVKVVRAVWCAARVHASHRCFKADHVLSRTAVCCANAEMRSIGVYADQTSAGRNHAKWRAELVRPAKLANWLPLNLVNPPRCGGVAAAAEKNGLGYERVLNQTWCCVTERSVNVNYWILRENWRLIVGVIYRFSTFATAFIH